MSSDRIYNTTQIERELLYSLLTDKMVLLKACNKVSYDFFSNNRRKFIFDKVKNGFIEFRSVVSKDLLIYEVHKTFDEDLEKSIVDDYLKEIDIIYKSKPTEKIEFFSEKILALANKIQKS